MANETRNDDNSAGQWLRGFKGCEHYTDEEAGEIADSLDLLAAILLENAAQKLHCNIYSNEIQHKKPKIAA
ncbi:hypothetical protein CJD36_017665 [Flavipsychrobacter stenotrophus]|uniref:Uncharacterized protein n=1 Tax=Flavipsychrobacter stenotrophus TaxID=2077091 RepID=A0A2S7ST26_9BACT|nr:hypothetical protein [Flavipsychrobacter stenotrophus]PQJ09755.1 hypothetical protein CJD36_017665 [Flavipsychrobacter stenotrophus]